LTIVPLTTASRGDPTHGATAHSHHLPARTMADELDYYSVLELSREATDSQIKQASVFSVACSRAPWGSLRKAGSDAHAIDGHER
jgi:hypothetical protein